jgi:hypothetical protein
MTALTLNMTDPERLVALGSLCARTHEIELEYTLEDPSWTGNPGSTAERDRSYPGPNPTRSMWRPAVLSSPYQLARIYIRAVTEYALSLAKMLADPSGFEDGILAAEVVSRAGLEAAARAWWLLESGISTRRRVARYLGDMAYSSYEAQEYAKKLGFAKSAVSSFGLAPELHKQVTMCNELELTCTGFSDGSPSIDGQRRPSNTAVVAGLIGDTAYRHQKRSVYSLTSGSGHATVFALLRHFVLTDQTLGTAQVLAPVRHQEAIDLACTALLSGFIAVMNRAVKVLGWGYLRIDLFENRLNGLYLDGP